MGIIPGVAGLGMDASGMHLKLPLAAALGHHPGMDYASAMGSLSGLSGPLGAFPMASASGHMSDMTGLNHPPASFSHWPSQGEACSYDLFLNLPSFNRSG
jgi:hypothetical protein